MLERTQCLNSRPLSQYLLYCNGELFTRQSGFRLGRPLDKGLPEKNRMIGTELLATVADGFRLVYRALSICRSVPEGQLGSSLETALWPWNPGPLS